MTEQQEQHGGADGPADVRHAAVVGSVSRAGCGGRSADAAAHYVAADGTVAAAVVDGIGHGGGVEELGPVLRRRRPGWPRPGARWPGCSRGRAGHRSGAGGARAGRRRGGRGAAAGPARCRGAGRLRQGTVDAVYGFQRPFRKVSFLGVAVGPGRHQRDGIGIHHAVVSADDRHPSPVIVDGGFPGQREAAAAFPAATASSQSMVAHDPDSPLSTLGGRVDKCG